MADHNPLLCTPDAVDRLSPAAGCQVPTGEEIRGCRRSLMSQDRQQDEALLDDIKEGTDQVKQSCTQDGKTTEHPAYTVHENQHKTINGKEAGKDVIGTDELRAHQLEVDKRASTRDGKTMEINPKDSIMTELRQKAVADKADKTIKDLIWLLLDTSLLTSCINLDEPTQIAGRIHHVIKHGLSFDDDGEGNGSHRVNLNSGAQAGGVTHVQVNQKAAFMHP